ncbi:MAG TPA: hypothetical protein VEX43_15315 [Chthoniobacterales bacterium]|nr:hypothetical protein [Chthoniobacterales bacterium]
MNKATHLLAVVTCLSLAGWGRAAEATPANSPTPAASPSPRLPAKDKVVVYSGAAIIDGTGGPLRPEMAIITHGERIEAIVPLAELKLPPGAEVVDVEGHYALPGFINSHEHLATPSQFLLCGFASLRDKACGSHAKAQRRKGG